MMMNETQLTPQTGFQATCFWLIRPDTLIMTAAGGHVTFEQVLATALLDDVYLFRQHWQSVYDVIVSDKAGHSVINASAVVKGRPRPETMKNKHVRLNDIACSDMNQNYCAAAVISLKF